MKQISILLIAFLFLSSSGSRASVSLDWLRSINGHLEGGVAIARDASDNVYTAGSGGGYMYLTKRDRFGNFQWEVSSTSSVGEIPVGVFIDPQGNPVMVGFRYSTLEEGPFAVSLIVLKYDPSGNLVYKKNVDGTYTYFNNSLNRTKVTAVMDAVGNVYIATGGIVTGYPNPGFNVVKITPAGTLAWVSTQTFGGSSFYLVSNITMVGNRLGLTGPISYYAGNPGTWVLDTTGATIWKKTSTGSGANDVAIDNKGNTYILTLLSNIAGPTTGSDICVYKFGKTGMQLWLKGYDFNSNEIGIKMAFSRDKNLVIMSDGSQINGGMPYVDWITFKVDVNGNLLWSNRYDETPGNDEIPRAMAFDGKSNVYVTGSGGPWPGGSDSGALQGVTLKYSSSGALMWTALVDTLGFNGVGIALASDTSLFVVSASAAAVTHYLQFTGSDPCLVPINLSANTITTDGAMINWDAVANAFLYHVEYKTSTGSTWIEISTDGNQYTLSNLFSGTSYDYRIEAICNSGPTGFSSVGQFTTAGAGYCVSKGLDASKEWVDYVLLGAIGNYSQNNGGYADFTYLSADLMQGSTNNSMALRAGMNLGSYTETWRVWIDFNHDGDFTDPSELVVAYKSSQIGLEFHTFSVPVNATVGATRMRVSIKKGTPAQTSCEIFSRGEVEDYSINIIPLKQSSEETNVNIIPELSLYPNPATDQINIHLAGWNGEVKLSIYDLSGKLMETQNVNSDSLIEMSIAELTSGVYLLRAIDEAGSSSYLKWVKQ